MLSRRLVAATRTISRSDERLRAEEAALTQLLAEGSLKTLLPEHLPDFVGSEHEVWSDGDKVLKATLPGSFGRRWGSRRFASPSEYLERMRILGDAFAFPWVMIGLAEESGRVRIVSEQPYVQGEPPTLEDIDAYMTDLGFAFKRHRFGDCWYRRTDELLVFDAEPGNFVGTGDSLVPVDLIVQRELPRVFD